MVDGRPQVDRQRFGLADLFAIVAAMALALAVMKALFGAGLIRFVSQTSLVRPAEPSLDAQLPYVAGMTALVGFAFCLPMIITAQYLARRRHDRPSAREFIGMAPGASLSIIFATLALDRYLLHVWRGASETIMTLAMSMLCGAMAGAMACLLTTSRASWQWTDWLGCATAITFGLLMCWSIFGG